MGMVMALGAGAGVAALAVNQMELKAEDDAFKDVLETENRIRQFSKPETIFDYFSSYQALSLKGKKTTLMSVSDFYNALTPGSSLTHGTGRGVYTILTQEEIHSKQLYDQEKIPCDNSILNKIQENGLLTYIDFVFLTHMVATPRRYIDIAFHAFDISADGIVEAREFIHVMAKIVGHKGDPDELLKETMSGLLPAFFGTDFKKQLRKEDFLGIQEKLIDEMLYLEYGRYDKENKNSISEADFCRNILYNVNLPTKKKEKMIKRVEKVFSKKSVGISFDDYRTFYHLLFGGTDLERAMFFLDTESERTGVNQEEFSNIAKWVLGGKEVNDHVVDVIFTLLDEDGDKNLSVKEFVPVMFQWRNARGFDKASVQVALGSLKI